MSLGDVDIPEDEEIGEEMEETTDEDYDEEAEPQKEGAEEGQESQQQPSQPSQSAPNQEEIRQRSEQFRRQIAYEQEMRSAIGKMNPYTGVPIQTPEDYREYIAAHEAAKKRAETARLFGRIQEGTAAPEELDKYIQTIVQQQLRVSPDIQRARAAADRAEQAERQAKVDAGRNRLQEDISLLNKEYPNCGIKGPEDITNPEMIGYLRQGLNIQDAYYLTHRQEIMQAQQAAARQATINQAAGKAHLKTTTGQAADDEGVTEEMIEQFMPYNKGKSRAELVEYIKRYGM